MPGSNQRKFTDEELAEFRRQQAERLHKEIVVDPETGIERRKFGGPQAGSGPKKKRAAATVKDWLSDEENAQTVLDALTSPLGASNAPSIRAKAAERVLAIARQDEQDEGAERRDELEQARRNEVLGGILRKLGVGGQEHPDVVLDADFTEEPDDRADDYPALPPPQ